MRLPSKPSRIDFDRVNIDAINNILQTGDLSGLSAAEKEYFGLMEMVRGLRARTLLPGGQKLTTKSAIIKLLKNQYGLGDWQARRVYDDSINFFYSESNVSTRAWSNLYADKLEKMADLAFASGNFKDGKSLLAEAAKLRGCYDDEATTEIPDELLEQRSNIIYLTDAKQIGAPAADRAELTEFIDSIPDVPEAVRDRVKEDAGIKSKNIFNRMMQDAKDFAEDYE